MSKTNPSQTNRKRVRSTRGENGKLPSHQSTSLSDRSVKMEAIGKKLGGLDSRRQDLAKKLDEAQKAADYDEFRRIGNNYLGTILESINMYVELIKEISSEPVAGELKKELTEIVKKGSLSSAIESQSVWISDDVSPLYEKVRQICACVYAAVAKIDQDANPIA